MDEKKTYTVTVETLPDGTRQMVRRNDGFTPLELLGICHLASMEIQQMIAGSLNVDRIERIAVG